MSAVKHEREPAPTAEEQRPHIGQAGAVREPEELRCNCLTEHSGDMGTAFLHTPWLLVSRLNDIGIALTSEIRLENLLELILTEARALTGCDGGSLYTVEDGSLHFQVAQNDTLARRPPEDQPKYEKMALPLNTQSIAGYVALSGEVVNLPDVYHLPSGVPYRFNKEFFDVPYGYRTTSMLTLPLRNRQQEVLGVLQLINALDQNGQVVPFCPFMEKLCKSMASHAAVALNNVRHIEFIKQAQQRLIRSEKLAAVGRLTAGVSHEVLNPLNIVIMHLQMMISDTSTNPMFQRNLKTMLEQAERISKITKDLLYFGRQRHPERIRLDLNATVNRTLGLLEYDFKQSKIDVALEFSDELPLIWADHDQLQQVVLNLLTNARDAMPRGGRVSIKTSRAQTNGNDFLELRIEDTGQGISEENMNKLFDPFFTTKPEGEGTGLGLSICKGIIEAHDGSIWAESQEGLGTTFIIQLPLEEPRNNGPDR